MGIFTATGTPNPAWTFPTNDTQHQSDSKTLTLDATSNPTVAAIGGAGTVLSSGGGNMELVAGGAAPEPSTLVSLIGAGGLIGMLRRRRAVK